MIQACINLEGRKAPIKITPSISNAFDVFAANKVLGRQRLFISSLAVIEWK
jgi:hypothetical protein